MASFSFEQVIAAPPETVFEVFTDHRRYADITSLRRSELEREGEPPPNGVGAVRALHSVGPPLREEVVAYQPPSRFSYRIVSGAPVRDHLGSVALEEVPGGTKVTYVVKVIPSWRLGGGIVVAMTRLAVRHLLRGVVRESESRAAAG